MSFDPFDERLYTKLIENWDTTYFPHDESTKVIRDSACPHCENNPKNIYAIFKESDSFGPVSEYAMCKDCYSVEKEKIQESEVGCEDCKQMKKRSEVTPWKWYDFYAPQGDEPHNVCKDCWTKPLHQHRMAQDREDRDQELGQDDYSEPYPRSLLARHKMEPLRWNF